jgi:2-oxoglutarate ferredoxin oxidoreductase subunit delta
MAKVIFEEARCKGCALCVDACPRKIVSLARDRLNQKGYHPAQVSEQEKCVGCAFCAVMCPDCVITVER